VALPHAKSLISFRFLLLLLLFNKIYLIENHFFPKNEHPLFFALDFVKDLEKLRYRLFGPHFKKVLSLVAKIPTRSNIFYTNARKPAPTLAFGPLVL
jgi:hypothetical protein